MPLWSFGKTPDLFVCFFPRGEWQRSWLFAVRGYELMHLSGMSLRRDVITCFRWRCRQLQTKASPLTVALATHVHVQATLPPPFFWCKLGQFKSFPTVWPRCHPGLRVGVASLLCSAEFASTSKSCTSKLTLRVHEQTVPHKLQLVSLWYCCNCIRTKRFCTNAIVGGCQVLVAPV